jgi:hypothetical protein
MINIKKPTNMDTKTLIILLAAFRGAGISGMMKYLWVIQREYNLKIPKLKIFLVFGDNVVISFRFKFRKYEIVRKNQEGSREAAPKVETCGVQHGLL